MTVCAPRALASILVAAAVGCSTSVGSVGAVLARDNATGALYVRKAPPGLAADKPGLAEDDQVLMIDGVYAANFSPDELRKHLRGDVGSSVELTIVRRGEVRRVKVVRTALKERTTPK